MKRRLTCAFSAALADARYNRSIGAKFAGLLQSGVPVRIADTAP